MTASAIALAVALLAGCSTPGPIKELASQGSATVGLAEISLRDYVALSQHQLAARLELMRGQAQREAADQSRHDLDALFDREAGEASADAVVDKVKQLGEERRRLREKSIDELKVLEKKFALDAAAIPPLPTEKLAAAKKSFALLSQELSAQEWLALAKGYAKEIKAGVDQLKDAPVTP
ncbi:MAG: hypothetical protein EOP36_10335 [Rubrivivax sp.]|nr:MAG: hypothetical protein EOP36_10335 [Rubrivivax sp.]